MKAKMSEVRILVKNISEAQHRYFLVYSDFAKSFDDLDIQIPYVSKQHPSNLREDVFLRNGTRLSIDTNRTEWQIDNCATVSGYIDNMNIKFGITSNIAKRLPVFCYAYISDSKAVQMCSSFGPKITCEPCVYGGNSSIYCYSME